MSASPNNSDVRGLLIGVLGCAGAVASARATWRACLGEDLRVADALVARLDAAAELPGARAKWERARAARAALAASVGDLDSALERLAAATRSRFGTLVEGQRRSAEFVLALLDAVIDGGSITTVLSLGASIESDPSGRAADRFCSAVGGVDPAFLASKGPHRPNNHDARHLVRVGMSKLYRRGLDDMAFLRDAKPAYLGSAIRTNAQEAHIELDRGDRERFSAGAKRTALGQSGPLTKSAAERVEFDEAAMLSVDAAQAGALEALLADEERRQALAHVRALRERLPNDLRELLDDWTNGEDPETACTRRGWPVKRAKALRMRVKRARESHAPNLAS